MNNDRFLLARYIKEFIMSLDEYLLNYPRKYFELRNRLVNNSYDLLEDIFIANNTERSLRTSIQVKAKARINMIDFYLEESFKKKIISERQTKKLSRQLDIINKMLYKWLENDKCEI